MALWLVRAGRYGEFEDRFLSLNAVGMTWRELANTSLSEAKDPAGVKKILQRTYPNEPPRKLGNWAGQISAFALGMKAGDWVVLPRKSQASIAVGEITGPYSFDPNAEEAIRHQRPVKWMNKEVPRSAFSQDLLYSFGAFMTICQVQRNDAEKRVRAMAKNGWKESLLHGRSEGDSNLAVEEVDGLRDLGQFARDQIAKFIERTYKGHELARLVAAILEAQGYATHVSPAGPDKGVDILAAPDPLGFGSPRICVQVKSGDEPIDRPTLDQLIGVMQNVGAHQGLLVSWSGFKTSVEREKPEKFFKVRLWDADSLIDQLLAQYDRLPMDLRTELPLKQIWTVAVQEEAA